MCDWLNRKAASKNIEIPFPGINPLQPDNGERFLYPYLLQQSTRNAQQVGQPEDSLCPCVDCVLPTSDAIVGESPLVEMDDESEFCEDDHQPAGIPPLPILPPENDALDTILPPSNAAVEFARCELVEPPNLDATRCFPIAPYRCDTYSLFVCQQADRHRLGQKLIRGRPPHSHACPKARDWSARQVRRPPL